MLPPFDRPNANPGIGAFDGDGWGDYDQPYRFGWRPTASAPNPFNTRQYARLLVLRSRVHDHLGASLELVSCHDSNWRATRGVCGESEDG